MKKELLNKAKAGRHFVRTPRYALAPERNVFAVLRDLMPRRALTVAESDTLAELQATHLLRLAGLAGPATPNELLTELPRLQVVEEPDLPSSASALWVSGRWLVLLNGAEPATRRRFSLAHEVKHCLDHPQRHRLYQDRPGLSADAQAERAADVFAAALLMPKLWIRRSWTSGEQTISGLASMFQVSPEAMARRLETLGLRERSGDRHSDSDATAQRALEGSR
jgi:predicted transcriptional regulator